MSAKLNSLIYSIGAFLFTLTFAIAVPILCRPFYYLEIKMLHIEERTGYSYQVIRGAFDEVMDYLVFNRPFGTGELAWSPSGKSHFEDCRFLFQLDFLVLALSALLIITIVLLYRKHRISIYCFRGYSPLFYTGIFNIALIATLGIWGTLSFDTLFVAFHRAFFPGKTNWIFDYEKDQIINILPEEFFFHCVILILGIILILSAFFLFCGMKQKKRDVV